MHQSQGLIIDQPEPELGVKFTCDQSTKTSKARSLSVAFSNEHLKYAVETSRSTSLSD